MVFLVGLLTGLGLALAVLTPVALVARRRFSASGGTFRCQVRIPSGGRRRRWRRWPAFRTRARWVHDVLVVRSAPLGIAALPLAARVAPGAVLRPVSPAQVRGLGARPWALLLTTEDRRPVDVAVAETDRDLLVGPYFAAALDGLPSAPREKGT